MPDILVSLALWLLPLLAMSAALDARRAEAEGGAGGERGAEPRRGRPGASSIALWCVVAVPSLLQLVVPPLLPALRRDWPLILDGQVWRLVTSVLVQDGGLVSTVFNLVILALVAVGAHGRWSGVRTWATFWCGAVAANCIVGPHLNPVGAGNSMATFVVATALAMNVLVTRSTRRARLMAVGALLAVAVMLGAGNYHGYAALVGLVAGVIPRRGVRRERAG